jgi:hypothetical protein
MSEHDKTIEPGPNSALCQKWQEVEEGWGERPDGFSLHLSQEGMHAFITAYLERQGITSDTADLPAEYSHPFGDAYPVGISDRWHEELQGEEHESIMFPESWSLPGSGGVDGWMPMQREQVGPDAEQ